MKIELKTIGYIALRNRKLGAICNDGIVEIVSTIEEATLILENKASSIRLMHNLRQLANVVKLTAIQAKMVIAKKFLKAKYSFKRWTDLLRLKLQYNSLLCSI